MRGTLHTMRHAAPMGWMQLHFCHQKPSWKCSGFSTSCGQLVKVKKKQQYVQIEDRDRELIAWWQEKMNTCKKSTTREMIKLLVPTNLLGLDANLRYGSLKDGTLNSEMLEVKRRFPHEVLMCRVGDFYEACGFDACMLVEYAGLNPMGGLRSHSTPRAGCPVANLRQTIDDLTKHGLSVCVMEEVQGPAQAKQRKDRFIAGHAHPGSPYIYGLAEADTDIEFPEPCPVAGISYSIRGYCLISVLELMRTYTVEDGLTEEALVTKLRSMQYLQLFLHRSIREDSGKWRSSLLAVESKGKHFEWFDQEPVPHLLSQVREMYDLNDKEEFREIVRPSGKRPRPIYMGTAAEIGVLQVPGIPNLLKVLVPSDCPAHCVRYFKDLLLNPPPYTVAASIQETIKLMGNLTCGIPEFVCEPAAKLVKLIGAREVNHLEFTRIKNLAEDVLYMYDHEELRKIFHLLLEPTGLATGLKIEAELLVKDCQELIKKVSSVIHFGTQDTISSEHIPDEFFNDMESGWRCRVQRKHAEECYADVDKAAAELISAVVDDFLPVLMRTRSLVQTSFGNGRGEVCYVREHQAVWFKGKNFKPVLWGETPGEEEIKRLKPAFDAKGRKAGEEWYTTTRVEAALTRYREAVGKANAAVVQILRGLADDVRSMLNSIIFISMFCVIAKALFAHASEGKRRRWTFPRLATQQEKLVFNGLVPYWLETSQDHVVPNSFEMNSVFLLTGPNGGGKSSLLRSVCAATLLGMCGLMVPTKEAVIPQFDSIMLRVMSHDSPSDGKSLFQMEMAELKTIILEATQGSLVLVDELCKGTEVEKGMCILGSVLEKFDRVGCFGIVSTHLHGLLDMKLNVKNIVKKAMGTRRINGNQVEPTWELVDGECRESLAFETAKGEGVTDEILHRARQLYGETFAIRMERASACMDSPPPLPEPTPFIEVNNIRAQDVKSLKDLEKPFLSICREYTNASRCYVVGPRQQPPPFTTNHSCVYILQRPDGKFYIGQTDNLAGRIASHRSSPGLKQAPFIYIPVSNKSIACQVETALINQLSQRGLSLINKVDQKHKHFGINPIEAPF